MLLKKNSVERDKRVKRERITLTYNVVKGESIVNGEKLWNYQWFWCYQDWEQKVSENISVFIEIYVDINYIKRYNRYWESLKK